MAGPVSAVEAGFTDVPAGSPYYDAVMFAAEQGITSGTGANHFSPDESITARQLAVMLSRALNWETEDAPFGDSELQTCYQYGIMDDTVMYNPDGDMSIWNLYDAVFNAFDIEVYAPDLYGGEAQLNYQPAADVMAAVHYIGLVPEDTVGYETATRGAAVTAIWQFMTQDCSLPEPEVLQHVDLYVPYGDDVGPYLENLSVIPTPLLDMFTEDGWAYSLDYSYIIAYEEYTGNYGVSGLCSYGNKIIFLIMPNAVLHEFGHYLDYTLGRPSDTLAYEMEASASFMREYGMTSPHEWYADYFAMYLAGNGDPALMDKMQALTPDTYAHFRAMSDAGWVLE